MNRKLYLPALSLFIAFSVGFYVYMHSDRGRTFDEVQTVHVKIIDGNPQLYRNGKPFYIKGASGGSYLKELHEAGGNTLRTYDTINLKSLLDEAEQYHVAIIVGIFIPKYSELSDFYNDSISVKELKTNIRDLVKQYKNHPALLFWNLGNEVNYPLTLNMNSFKKVYNELIDIIHEEDPNHPVSTSVSGTSRSQTIGLHLHAPKLDIIGFNAFSNLPEVAPLMKNMRYLTKTKPYYIMEWGNRGPWDAPVNLWKSVLEPNSTEKGDIYKDIYNSYIKNDGACLGSLAFYWGYKHEGTTTWWNIFDEEGRKSEVYYELKSLWTNTKPRIHSAPQIDLMLINDSHLNHQILDSSSTLKVQVKMRKEIEPNMSFIWNIYKEAWGHQEWLSGSEGILYSKALDNFTVTTNLGIPEQDGPYRLVISIHDRKGNYATSNMPFYVLNHAK